MQHKVLNATKASDLYAMAEVFQRMRSYNRLNMECLRINCKQNGTLLLLCFGRGEEQSSSAFLIPSTALQSIKNSADPPPQIYLNSWAPFVNPHSNKSGIFTNKKLLLTVNKLQVCVETCYKSNNFPSSNGKKNYD